MVKFATGGRRDGSDQGVGHAVARSVSRRTLLAGAVATGIAASLGDATAAGQKATFTILHTNDLHSNFVGVAPVSDYDPSTPHNDGTRGGFERLATMIAARKAACHDTGPVLILDAATTAWVPLAAATWETGGELQLLSMMGFDATTSVTMISTSGQTARRLRSRLPPRRAGCRRWWHPIPTFRRTIRVWRACSG